MSIELLAASELPEYLERDRFLTEVDRIQAHLDANGNCDPAIRLATEINLAAAAQEGGMSGCAVTDTTHWVDYRPNDQGRMERMFVWAGKCAIEVAKSGYNYHYSDAAKRRVDVEVTEAHHNQATLRAGSAQVFISPKMSPHDAPEKVARQEHLALDDSLRVSELIVDGSGNVLGRRLRSLLVRDVPLNAWVAMLKDSHNIFGTAFNIRDEASALSIMELFEDLELPQDKVPEGPVTLVAAVLPYVTDEHARAQVAHQLERFRGNQKLYEDRAMKTARQWFEFELALANSLENGAATLSVKSFIVSLQHEWGAGQLAIIADHELPDGEYRMTRELAALLEKAKQYIIHTASAIAVKNEAVLEQLDAQTAQDIQDQVAFIDYLEAMGASDDQVAIATALLQRQIAQQNVVVGGGCPGEIESSFGNTNKLTGEAGSTAVQGKEGWQWKPGVCRIRNCPSPRPTSIGPCHVCRGCQHLYDAGRDPAKVYAVSVRRSVHAKPIEIGLLKLRSSEKKRSGPLNASIGSLALAA